MTQIVRFADARGAGLAANRGDGYRAVWADQPAWPGDLPELIAQGSDLAALIDQLHAGVPIDLGQVTVLPPLPAPGKILAVGLNYIDHAKEGNFEIPTYPTVFGRFSSGLIGHGAPIVRPHVSDQLDYEAELAVIVGLKGRSIPEEEALLHVAGYSIFNDASIRDYQFKSPQWTLGKNFDDTGAFGPCFVPASALPAGASGLRIQARLNGAVVQDSSTGDMIFSVARLVSLLSEVMTLEPGDVIITGTPAGVGFARKPPLWMKPGDVCEIEIEGIGILRNPVVQQG